MLGHKLSQIYSNRFETWVTTHSAGTDIAKLGICDSKRLLNGVDALRFDTVTRAVRDAHPDVILNCIGIIKQSPHIQDVVETIELNSVFPHKLALLCQAAHARLIHISTDCVFSGRKGMYTENDISDAEDLYGRTKFLGEVQSSGCLTLRTSIIGRELNSTYGFLEWFLSQRKGRVKGYMGAIYSGFTTQTLAVIIEDLLLNHPSIEGLYNVSSEPITKYELLRLLKQAYKKGTTIDVDEQVRVDRSLDSTRFRADTGFSPKTWPEMITKMANDSTPYEEWRRILNDAS